MDRADNNSGSGLAPLLFITVLIVSDDYPWLFERNTPEQKVLLEMLAIAASAPDEWSAQGPHLLHSHTGICVRPSYWGSWRNYEAIIDTRTIDYPKDSRGHRIIARLYAAREEQDARAADLATLKVLTEKFQRDWGL